MPNSYGQTLGVVVGFGFKLVNPVVAVSVEGTAVGLNVGPKKNLNTKNLNFAHDS